MPLGPPTAASSPASTAGACARVQKWRGFIKRVELTQVAQRLLPGAVRGLAQNVPLKNGLAVIGSAGALGTFARTASSSASIMVRLMCEPPEENLRPNVSNAGEAGGSRVRKGR